MPGDARQKFANLRAYYGWMFAFRGKTAVYGQQFAQGREWNHDASLDWHLLEGDDNWHHGVQRLVRDLNHTYRHHKALHELDFDPYGFGGWLSMTTNGRYLSLSVAIKPGTRSSWPATSRRYRVTAIASGLISRGAGVKS